MNSANNNFAGAGDNHGRPIRGKPFTLSATAKEFIPRTFAPGPMMPGPGPMNQQGQQPNPYTTHGGPPGVQRHMYNEPPQPRFQQAPSGPNPMEHRHAAPPRGGHHGHAPVHHPHQHQQHQQPLGPSPQDPMTQLKQAILIMTKDPSSFDDTMPELTSSLATNIRSEEKLIRMVEEIFRQSVEEANFRYTGARICNYFSHHLVVCFTSPNFKQHILRRCHEEHKKREDLVKNCDNRYKLVGFTLFMGELLLNMTEFAKTKETNEYRTIVSQAVQELLSTLLSQPADDTLRCTVQVLKLCGSVVEDTEQACNEDRSTPKLDQTFNTIKESVLETIYHKGMRAQMLSVIELRASDWGRPTSSGSSQKSAPPPISNSAPPPLPPVQQMPPAPAPSFPPTGPVSPGTMFYGDPNNPTAAAPDAPQFGNYYPDDMLYYSSGEEDWQNPEDYFFMYDGVECIQEDEMDPEIAAAFQEFLSNQPQQG